MDPDLVNKFQVIEWKPHEATYK